MCPGRSCPLGVGTRSQGLGGRHRRAPRHVLPPPHSPRPTPQTPADGHAPREGPPQGHRAGLAPPARHVTLLHDSRSTKRAPECIWHIDMVHDPHDPHDTKRASPRHICRAVKQTRKGLQHAYSTSRPRPRHPSHIVAPPLQENWAALLMRAAPPRRRAPAATCCPEPRLCRLQPASERWSTRFA